MGARSRRARGGAARSSLLGSGASSGNAGWIVPSLATPLASPGILATGLRSALDPRGALVIRPSLDPAWLAWLWRFARSSRAASYRRGVAALHAATMRSLDELDRMRDDGVSFEEHRAGLLVVARDRAGLKWFDLLFDELDRLGFEGRLEHMDGDAARELEPSLGAAVGSATRTSIDRHVAPESLVAGLARRAVELGATIREDVRVSALRRERTGWTLVVERGEPAVASHVVLASALGTAALAAPLGLRLPLVGAKGYSVTVRVPGPAPRVPLYLCEPKLGVTPLDNGLRIAGFFELGGHDPAPSERRARQLLEEALPFLPQLAGASPLEGPRGWAGLRPSTPDSLPLLGLVPGAPGVIVATGHGMLGVTLAPATGRAVAELVVGVRPEWLAPFDPARLGARVAR